MTDCPLEHLCFHCVHSCKQYDYTKKLEKVICFCDGFKICSLIIYNTITFKGTKGIIFPKKKGVPPFLMIRPSLSGFLKLFTKQSCYSKALLTGMNTFLTLLIVFNLSMHIQKICPVPFLLIRHKPLPHLPSLRNGRGFFIRLLCKKYRPVFARRYFQNKKGTWIFISMHLTLL